MTIEKNKDGNALTIALTGYLDTSTAPELEAELEKSLVGIESLTLDFDNLEYLSSAGLRVLLKAHKTMSNQGSMEICRASDTIKEIFGIVGFSDILNIA